MWIEINCHQLTVIIGCTSPPTRVVWIEILIQTLQKYLSVWSPPTRVVWIEIPNSQVVKCWDTVTTHTGGVDWNNCYPWRRFCKWRVTTHTGGVDWNYLLGHTRRNRESVTTHTGGVDWNQYLDAHDLTADSVTTHTGGVDWNLATVNGHLTFTVSPPTRVVWIEIIDLTLKKPSLMSPPTRVVWIEILDLFKAQNPEIVTTHTGGVDWNWYNHIFFTLGIRSPPTRVVWIEICADSFLYCSIVCHHPHGWCGLKYLANSSKHQNLSVTTHTGGVDWNPF